MANCPKCEELMLKIEELEHEIKLIKGELNPRESDIEHTMFLNVEERINLFYNLFASRNDVYAEKWISNGKKGYSPVCAIKWDKPRCQLPKVRCYECENRQFSTLTKKIVEKHLRGEMVIGVYRINKSNETKFLAIDFDKFSWKEDVLAVKNAADILGISSYIEVSSSGNGAHLWFFFKNLISARLARQLGERILVKGMELRHSISYDSYDRMFPNQDYLGNGGFGNLIALPLQKNVRNLHFTEFVDDNFNVIENQWDVLNNVTQIDVTEIMTAINSDDEIIVEHKPWEKQTNPVLTQNDFSETIEIVVANGVFINKKSLSSNAISKLKELAVFKNPEFYKKQKLRLPVFNVPSRIVCFADFDEYLRLPRGLIKEVKEFFHQNNVEYLIVNKINDQKKIDVEFIGKLREEQSTVVDRLLNQETGVLQAPTGFGKTVVAAGLISEIKSNTLIIVPTKQLLLQWIERLNQFLIVNEEKNIKISPKGRKMKLPLIGQIGGGKKRPGKIIDVAIMKSLIVKDEVIDEIKDYGTIIVDECHHVPAFSFEMIMNSVNAKNIFGLSATPYRKDKLDPIIFWQCGEKIVAYGEEKLLSRTVRKINYISYEHAEINVPIATFYSKIAEDNKRNNLIIDEIIKCLDDKRKILVLSERINHVQILKEMLPSDKCICLTGKLSKKELSKSLANLHEYIDGYVVFATGKYVGEGLDISELDTLFLTMPVSWKGVTTQYIGRIERNHPKKDNVLILDLVDALPVAKKMYKNREKVYINQGYQIDDGFYDVKM